MIDRKEGIKILKEWVKNSNLRKHLYATAYCMEAYAEKLGKDKDKWFLTGLLHDLDYEKYPDEHPFKAIEFLKDKVDEDVIEAIRKHAFPELKRESELEKFLVAIDELTGFLIAVSLVMPQKSFKEIKLTTFKKKWKDKAFARGVDRKLVETFVSEANLVMEEHVDFMLKVLSDKEKDLYDD
ncbi:MAG: HD domain-containing protein [Candidatus Hydrothermales bacterium]